MSDRYIQSPEVEAFIGHDAILAPAEMLQLRATREVDSEATEGIQRIYYGVTDVENPVALAIAPAAWSDFAARPFNAARYGAVSAMTGMRVAHMDFIGMGHPEDKAHALTELQIEQAQRGRMADVAAAQWFALERGGHTLDDDGNRLPVVFLDHSQGTLNGAEMIALAPEGTEIAAIMTSENMALAGMNYLRFGGGFLVRGSKHMKDYTPLNGDTFPPDEADLVGQVKAQLATHIRHTPKAMSMGRQAEIMTEAVKSGRINLDKEHGTRLHSVRAEHGIVNAKQETKFHKQMRGLGIDVTDQTLLGEGHAYQNAIPALFAVINRALGDRFQ